MFHNMMKHNTCVKYDGGPCIDLLITNLKFLFMKTNSFETGLSDHDHMIYTILKTKFEKFEPKKSIYRNIKQYDSDQINWIYLIVCLLREPMQPLRIILFQC